MLSKYAPKPVLCQANPARNRVLTRRAAMVALPSLRGVTPAEPMARTPSGQPARMPALLTPYLRPN
jgi:hypothetical protein